VSLEKNAALENCKNWNTFTGFTLGSVWIPSEFTEVENNIKSFIFSNRINKLTFCSIKITIKRMALDVIKS
jgi:hypothetical protein